MRFLLFILLLVTASCSLFSNLKQREFTYRSGGHDQSIRVLVPTGYHRSEKVTDSAGNQGQVYHYGSGTFFYVAHTTDSSVAYQPIAEENNVPLPHPDGGLLYKGMDSSGLYWREVRLDSFRIGYRGVRASREIKFDAAVNASSRLKRKK